jgi:hypothetical protein
MNIDNFEALAITLKWLSQRDNTCMKCIDRVLVMLRESREGKIFTNKEINDCFCASCDAEFTKETDAQDADMMALLTTPPPKRKITAYRASRLRFVN